MVQLIRRQQYTGQPGYSVPNAGVGAAVYYGITAAIVVAIAIAIVIGKLLVQRKHRRQVEQRRDLERQEQTRRGEAAGLPTYLEHGGTTHVPMTTLPYPDPAYRPEMNALPSYEQNGPPKYEYPAPAGAPPRPSPSRVQVPQINVSETGAPQSQEMQEARSGVSVTTPLASPAATEQSRPNFFIRSSSHRSNNGEMETVPLDGPATVVTRQT